MKSNSFMFLFIFLVVGLTSCTKNDQVVTSTSTDNGNSSTLNAYFTSTAPVINAQNPDALWNNATSISVNPTVPDPGNNLFAGYWGEQYPATIQAMYDKTNLYLKVQWADNSYVDKPQPWVFDSVSHIWSQRSNVKSFDINDISLKIDSASFIESGFIFQLATINFCIV